MFKIPKENIVTVCVVLGNQHTVGSPGFCAKCSESVWLSETAVNSIRNRFHNNSLGWDDMTPICPACALKFMNQKKNDEGELEQTEVILPFGNINPSKDAIEKIEGVLKSQNQTRYN